MSSFDLDSIFGRIAAVAGVSRDSELAEVLGVSRQTLSKWKQRKTIPYEKIIDFAASNKVSLDEILFGIQETADRSLINIRLMSYIYDRIVENSRTVPVDDDSLGLFYEDNPPVHAASVYNLMIEKNLVKELPEFYLTETFKRVIDGVIAVYKQQLEKQHEEEQSLIEELKEWKESIQKQKEAETASSVRQSVHGSVGQLAGRDINNKK